jgi:hypothetical protein
LEFPKTAAYGTFHFPIWPFIPAPRAIVPKAGRMDLPKVVKLGQNREDVFVGVAEQCSIGHTSSCVRREFKRLTFELSGGMRSGPTAGANS